MLDSSIVIQLDATVIAGILILLTIGSFQDKRMREKITIKIFRHEFRYTAYSIVATIVIPFGASALTILAGDIISAINIEKVDLSNVPIIANYLGIVTTFIGFVYLVAIIYKLDEDIIPEKK